MNCKPNDWCPYERRRDAEKPREQGPVKTEAEAGVMQPQAKAAWRHRELEEAGRTVPWNLSKGSADTLALDVWPADCEMLNFWCFTANPDNVLKAMTSLCRQRSIQ